tara:strand:- start:11612 stop:12337 length:726 start_codon:yes stop_codon:yes gene_type:complete
MNQVDLIILCGGLGTRLRNLTGPAPKILTKINNTVFLEYLLNQVSDFNFSNVILSCGYGAEKIKDWVSRSKYRNTIKIVVEGAPRGTAGALKFSSENNGNDKIVINGDTILNFDYESFYNYSKNNLDICLAAKSVKKNNFNESGFIKIDNQNRILSFNEKQTEKLTSSDGLVNIGIYYFKSTCISLIPKKIPCSIEYDFLPKLLKRKSIKAITFIYDDIFIDFGTESGYKKAKIYFDSIKK